MSARKRSREDDFDADTDIRVIFDSGEEMKTYSLVLMLNSPVFKQMLQSGMDEQHSGEIRLPGKKIAEFEQFVAMLQITTQRPFSSDSDGDKDVPRAEYLAMWADEYQVTALTKMCDLQTKVYSVPGAVSRSAVAGKLQHALMYGLSQTAEALYTRVKADLVACMDDAATRTVLLSSDEYRCKVWKAICDAAGIAHSEPREEHIRSMWLFIRGAILRTKLVEKVQALPMTLYHGVTSNKVKADDAAKAFAQTMLARDEWKQLLQK